MLRRKNLVKLDDGLYQVKRALGSNVYLVTEPELALIDAGWPVDAPHIRAALRELGAGPGDLRDGDSHPLPWRPHRGHRPSEARRRGQGGHPHRRTPPTPPAMSLSTSSNSAYPG